MKLGRAQSGAIVPAAALNATAGLALPSAASAGPRYRTTWPRSGSRRRRRREAHAAAGAVRPQRRPPHTVRKRRVPLTRDPRTRPSHRVVREYGMEGDPSVTFSLLFSGQRNPCAVEPKGPPKQWCTLSADYRTLRGSAAHKPEAPAKETSPFADASGQHTSRGASEGGPRPSLRLRAAHKPEAPAKETSPFAGASGLSAAGSCLGIRIYRLPGSYLAELEGLLPRWHYSSLVGQERVHGNSAENPFFRLSQITALKLRSARVSLHVHGLTGMRSSRGLRARKGPEAWFPQHHWRMEQCRHNLPSVGSNERKPRPSKSCRPPRSTPTSAISRPSIEKPRGLHPTQEGWPGRLCRTRSGSGPELSHGVPIRGSFRARH